MSAVNGLSSVSGNHVDTQNLLTVESSEDLLRGIMTKMSKVEFLKLAIMLTGGNMKAFYCDTPNLKDIMTGLNTCSFTLQQVVDLLKCNPYVKYNIPNEDGFSDEYLGLLLELHDEMDGELGIWDKIFVDGVKVRSLREGFGKDFDVTVGVLGEDDDDKLCGDAQYRDEITSSGM